jgi:hypothetical protein
MVLTTVKEEHHRKHVHTISYLTKMVVIKVEKHREEAEDPTMEHFAKW